MMRIDMGNKFKDPGKLLKSAIEASGIAEVVRVSSDKTSVKLLHRVRHKRAWLAVLEFILSRADGWSAHVCQQYFMRGGKLIYGWNFILQPIECSVDEASLLVAKLLVKAAKIVPKVLATSQKDTFPLMGASHRRTARIAFDPRLPGPDKGGPSHKGAYDIKSGEQG